jgi:DNA excision repair protein ERCC-4
VKLPAELRPDGPTAIQDSREQRGLCLDPLRVEIGTLATGDYSIKGLEHVIAIERKSAEDMLGCIGRERERFDREIQRLLAYPVRAVVVEAGWRFFEAGEWRGNVTPNAAIGSLLGWITAGVPIVMAYDHERAGRFVSRILFTAARRRWREARALVANVTDQEQTELEAVA